MIFFVPLGINSLWGNNELKYMLRSLQANFMDEFDVVLYSTTTPEWYKGYSEQIERFYPERLLKINNGHRPFENYFDVLNKVYTYVNSEQCPKEFCYIYDDIILLKQIDKTGIKNVPWLHYTNKLFKVNQSSHNGKTTNQAYILHKAKYSFEHHLPLIYKKDLLKQMFNEYKFWEQARPYSLATLYFNLYPDEYSGKPLVEENDYKVGFEGFYENRTTCFKQDTYKDIEVAIAGKTWLNFNDTGLYWGKPDYPLKTWIVKNFKKKSRYE